MSNISGIGLKILVSTSVTFPLGFLVTTGSDDTDPLSFDDIVVGEAAMTTGGALVNWNKASPILCSLGIVPNSFDDQALASLINANRVSQGKGVSNDSIKMIATYPSGQVLTLSGGCILQGPPANSATSAGRLKSNVYKFAFQNSTVTGNIGIALPAIV